MNKQTMRGHSSAHARPSRARTLRAATDGGAPYLVVWVAVEEVGVNGPVEGDQRSLRLWGRQSPRLDEIKIWGRPGIKNEIGCVAV